MPCGNQLRIPTAKAPTQKVAVSKMQGRGPLASSEARASLMTSERRTTVLERFMCIEDADVAGHLTDSNQHQAGCSVYSVIKQRCPTAAQTRQLTTKTKKSQKPLIMFHQTHRVPAIVLICVFEDNQALIQMRITGRRPHIRHVSN